MKIMVVTKTWRGTSNDTMHGMGKFHRKTVIYQYVHTYMMLTQSVTVVWKNSPLDIFM